MTCVYCNDDPAISINCYCRTVTTFQKQPPLNLTKFVDDMRDLKKQINDITGISASMMFASSDSSFLKDDFGDRRYLPITTGLQLVESVHMTVPAEDWSRVRSPGRARRRIKRGYRQNIRYYQKPSPEVFVTDGKIMAHPETIRALTDRVAKETDKQVLNTLYGRL